MVLGIAVDTVDSTLNGIDLAVAAVDSAVCYTCVLSVLVFGNSRRLGDSGCMEQVDLLVVAEAGLLESG